MELDLVGAQDLDWYTYDPQTLGICVQRLRRDSEVSDRWWFDLVLPLDIDLGQSEGVQPVVVVRDCKARRMASGRYHVWPPEVRRLEGWHPLLLIPARLRRLVCGLIGAMVDRGEAE